MAFIWSIFSVSCSILVTPFLMFLLAIIFLASIGKSLGVRRLYVKVLLKIFEDSRLKFCSLPQYPPQSWGMHFMSLRYGRESIEIAKKDKQDSRDNSDDEDEDDDKEEKEAKQDSNGTNHIQVENHISSTTANNVNHNLKMEKQLKNGVLQNSSGVISREDLILAPDPEQNYTSNHSTSDNHLKVSSHLPRRRSFETLKREFELSDCLDYIKAGVEAIIEDQVTLRFEAEELKSWNLLTRTNRHYEFISWRLSVIWMVGFLMRYFFLLPLRILICFIGVMWLTICTAIVGYVPEGKFKRWLNHHVSIMCFGVLSSALSAVINYHNPENRPKRGICVANHTSPIDVLVLACDNCYSLIGQRHGGFLGVLQRALARASPHIWFERSEVKDREAVARRLREHVSDPNNPPILIFPEGTCINNTSVMQFKKGSFEVGSVIYPVAIKYDPKFGDAFWNSSRYSMMQYLYMMMSSWAIVCDVWYLPPMYQQPGESAIDFANRVKSAIARQGGLVDLMWDGQLKRMKAKPEWKEKQQEEFSKRLKVE